MSTSMIGLVVPATFALAAVLFGFAMRERRAPDPVRERSQLRRMRVIPLVEGTTLVILVFVAVPLKRFGGEPIATAIMGPVHGAAFLLYVIMLIRTVSGGSFARGEVARMAVAALVNDQHLLRSDNQVASERKSRFGDFGQSFSKSDYLCSQDETCSQCQPREP